MGQPVRCPAQYLSRFADSGMGKPMKSFTHLPNGNVTPWLVLVSVSEGLFVHMKALRPEFSTRPTQFNNGPVGLGERLSPNGLIISLLSQRNCWEDLQGYPSDRKASRRSPLWYRIHLIKQNHLYPYRRVGGTLSRPNTERRRENAIMKFSAVFLIGIGGELLTENLMMAVPDYDDWTTESENGYKGWMAFSLELESWVCAFEHQWGFG